MYRGILLLAAAACTGGPIPEDARLATSPTSPTSPTSTGPATVTDRIVQDVAQADILFVVDNSCSMTDDQRALTEAFPIYLDYFLASTIDYHMGVVRTDLDFYDQGGHLVEVNGERWISPTTPDPVTTFTEMALLGNTGSGNEKGLGAAYIALEVLRDTVNAGFLRDGSGLHLVVLSDERDHTPAGLIAEAEFVDWLLALGEERPATSFTSIVAADDRTYADISAEVGGSVHDIATVDYSLVMDLLGMETANLDRTFCPSVPADPATFAVSVERLDGTVQVLQAADFEVTAEGCVRFLVDPPAAGATVVLEYLPL